MRESYPPSDNERWRRRMGEKRDGGRRMREKRDGGKEDGGKGNGGEGGWGRRESYPP